MSRAAAADAVRRGSELAAELVEAGASLVALGDMGIGNTTASAAVTAALLGRDAREVCGPGTGLDAAGVAHKVHVVSRMLARNRPRADDPLGALAAAGRE
jgi:nicotinate-nucleotide--dimethylbenzimidazole phosphoribosyltransferase